MKLHTVPAESFKATAWSGGTTTELFIYPEGASFALRRFDFRISAASVALEESAFTPMPGIIRYITPLSEAGFVLRLGAAPARRLAKGEVVRFDGGIPVCCEGTGRDLNLMLYNCTGDMRCISPYETMALPEARFIFVYADDMASIICGESKFVIPARGLVRLIPDKQGEAFVAAAPVIALIVK